jgi:hypothetical protein
MFVVQSNQAGRFDVVASDGAIVGTFDTAEQAGQSAKARAAAQIVGEAYVSIRRNLGGIKALVEANMPQTDKGKAVSAAKRTEAVGLTALEQTFGAPGDEDTLSATADLIRADVVRIGHLLWRMGDKEFYGTAIPGGSYVGEVLTDLLYKLGVASGTAKAGQFDASGKACAEAAGFLKPSKKS